MEVTQFVKAREPAAKAAEASKTSRLLHWHGFRLLWED